MATTTSLPKPTLPSTLSSYIPLDKLTAEDFNAHLYANDLVKSVNTSSATGQPTHATSSPSDVLADLTTPLQKTLFDLQEIDTAIHSLTSRSAVEILRYTQQQNSTAVRILERVEEEKVRLVADYERLREEVLGRYERAEKARVGASRSLKLGRLGRDVGKVVALARSFESCLLESGLGSSPAAKEKHGELVRAAGIVLEFREVMNGRDAVELGKVNLVKQVRGRVFEDGEARLLDWARKAVREFSVASLVSSSAIGSTYKEAENAKARFTNAVHILYLLSPAPRLEEKRKMTEEEFEAEYLLRALQGYLQSAITSSAAGIGRGLAQLPQLDKALLEVSARCQSILAFEVLLRQITPPDHLLLQGKENPSKRRRRSRRSKRPKTDQGEEEIEDLEDGFDEFGMIADDEEGEGGDKNLLDPLLSALDTSSLASYFWRSLASSLTLKVQEILSRGGVSARALKTNRDIVRSEIRDSVLRGSQMPATLMGHGPSGKDEIVGSWEREAAVMVGSVIGPLNR